MELEKRLRDLLQEHEPHLSAYSWPSELNRWAELVFCLLHRFRPHDAEVTRQAVQVLLAAGLLDVRKLAKVDGDAATAFVYVLTSHDWTKTEATKALTALQKVANAIDERFGGKLQRGVRRLAGEMRRELGETLTVPGLNRLDLDHALTHWLQNAFSLPLSLENDAVRRFCRAYNVTVAELTDAADELDLNLALVDDVLEAHVASMPAPKSRPRPPSGRRRK